MPPRPYLLPPGGPKPPSLEERVASIEGKVDHMTGVLARVDAEAERRHELVASMHKMVRDTGDGVLRNEKALADITKKLMRIGTRLDDHEKRVQEIEKDVEATGQQNLEAIKKKADSLEESQKHYLRWTLQIAATIALMVLSAVLAYVLKR